MHYDSGARFLNTSPHLLANIVAGRKQATQQYLEDRNWRAQLQRRYPQVWEKHCRRFEAEAAKLPSKLLHWQKSPDDETTIGFVVWKIIGGPSYDADKASGALDFTRKQLYLMLHGRSRPSQVFIEERQWAQRLAKIYPDAWAEYGGEFLQRVRRSASVNMRIKSREPKDRSKLGYLLWKIIGGPWLRATVAKDVFGLSRDELDELFYGTKMPDLSQAQLVEWRKALALHYPKAWVDNRNEFERRVSKLPVRGSTCPLCGARVRGRGRSHR